MLVVWRMVSSLEFTFCTTDSYLSLIFELILSVFIDHNCYSVAYST
jgi:hypothetical protein